MAGKYEQQLPDENNRYWIKELNLFIGIWQGTKAEFTTNWLRGVRICFYHRVNRPRWSGKITRFTDYYPHRLLGFF